MGADSPDGGAGAGRPTGGESGPGEQPTTLSVPGVAALAAGRSRSRVRLPEGERWVTVGVVGEPDSLLGFEVIAPTEVGELRATDSLAEDGRLPRFVSFAATGPGGWLDVVVDVRAPAQLLFGLANPAEFAAADGQAQPPAAAAARPIVGLPLPLDLGDGYTVESPQRYMFLRADVALAMRAALRQTRIRFRRNPIGLGHASQWDAGAPGTDRGKSMHIGHRGGREIDLGLPSSDDSPSIITRRCEGVLVERSVLRCAPGTVRELDAIRLAYLLGLLIDGPTPNGAHMPKGRPGPIAIVHSILTDEAYIDEIRRAAVELRRKRWIHDEGFAAIVEDGILRPSPWHTDHVHLRFAGEDGLPLVSAAPVDTAPDGAANAR